MDSTLTFIVVFVFKPKRLAILNWSIFFCKKERAFLISGDFFLLLVEYVFLNLYFIFWHAFLKFKIKHSRVVIWELSICSLRWVPVLSIHSTILHTVRLATHPKYELNMCILQLELIFFWLILCAFQKGHLEVVKFLVANGCIDFDRAILKAVEVQMFFCYFFKFKAYI